ncbi:MAG: NAD(P)/FAD-dependent oxidoreductase [Vampirovibrionales bacterium]|nr:NAD(P)/FAD-dependent oxidoreductase [Vampirovibrionales bacterium]
MPQRTSFTSRLPEASPEVLIIGAGLSGLSCARALQAAGLEPGTSVVVLDGAPDIGGRVQTDVHEGFLLDRGFQVFLESYTEPKRLISPQAYAALKLKPFLPGALSWFNGKFHSVHDPRRMPWMALSTLMSPVGGFADKWRVLRDAPDWQACAPKDGIAPPFNEDDVPPGASSTKRVNPWRPMHSLFDAYSEAMRTRFWQPFLGGIMLDAGLSGPAWFAAYTLQMMQRGRVCLPEAGIAQIPQAIAAPLPPNAIVLGAGVASLDPALKQVTLTTGQTLQATRAIVLATSWQERARLFPLNHEAPSFNATTCFYFAASAAPLDEPVLVLNGSGQGVINSLCVPSLISSQYAPSGQTLISVSVIGQPEGRALGDLEQQVRTELAGWFGSQVKGWQALRHYRIPYALPRMNPDYATGEARFLLAPGLFACGDYMASPSMQGALASGRLCAKAVLRALGKSPV